MIENMRNGIFRIEIPLPGNPLKMLNAYCIKGKNRSLLIDTGFNQPECRTALFDGLAELDIRRDKLDVCITHRHADHSGLACDVPEGRGAKIWASAVEGSGISNFSRGETFWRDRVALMMPHGLSAAQAEELITKHPASRFAPSRVMEYDVLRDGEALTCADRVLQVIEVPGHAPGQITLYEPNLKIYFSADHILGDITPNIAKWSELKDALGSYLENLDKVAKLDIAVSYPGHRSIVADTRGRIEAIKHHHAMRLNEVRQILAKGKANGWVTASQMTWQMRFATWEEFPVSQKWFAIGEALAHLDHLVALGEVQVSESGGKIEYSLVCNHPSAVGSS